ncbi:MAG: hypothetical protein RNU03_18670 [Candidatus Sedimenticola sp. (ex Thyasira tokunagai)]
MTNLKKRKSEVNVGVDVGKRLLDVCIYEKGIHWQDENTADGIKRILKRLAYYHVERLVMEATGRYQLELAATAYKRVFLSASSSHYQYDAMPEQSINWPKQIRLMLRS